MIALFWILGWLGLGMVGIVASILSAPEDDPPFRDDWDSRTNSAYALMATVLGPFAALLALYRWLAVSVPRAKKEKKRIADELESELREAKKQVEDLLRRK